MWLDILTWFGLGIGIILLYFLYDHFARQASDDKESKR